MSTTINRPFTKPYVDDGEIRMCEKVLNPENITDADMKELANQLEDYLYEFNACMIIPKNMYEHDKNRILCGRKLVKKLIKKLREGKKDDIFKKEWEY